VERGHGAEVVSGVCGVTAARGRVGGHGPRPERASRAELVELVGAAVGESPGGAEARGQGTDRAEAGRSAGTCPVSAGAAAGRAREAGDPSRPDTLRALPAPAASGRRPGRPAACLAPGG